MNLLGTMPFYLSVEHDCSYLPGRRARNLVADPETLSPEVYTRLADHGFRRSGNFAYRPYCVGCEECRPLRLRVDAFEPRRSDLRALRRNADLTFRAETAELTDERFELYLRYLRVRHPGGGMDEASADDFRDFLTSHWCRTRFYEFRSDSKLLGIAVTDELEDGLSAIYTFYEPGESRRGLGTWAVLKQIAEARREGRLWLYLGFWVDGCRKMSYKTRFRPHEIYTQGVWRSLAPPGSEKSSA